MATYNVGGLIGKGGFGEVFEATRKEDGWSCALKQLQKSVGEKEHKRFEREVRMQAQLRHPNVVPIIASNLGDNPPWFVMPKALYSLREYLQQHKGEEELWVIFEIVAGIEHAHKNGIIHRDLKPENILFFIDKDKRLYTAVSDFGLGRFVSRDSPTLTQTNIRLGTVEYMAPEQYADTKNVDCCTDIYALGKIMYEVLTGEIPYPTMDITKIPMKFAYIVQKACHPDRNLRYQSVNEMINHLNIVTQEDEYPTIPAENIRKEIRKTLEEQEFTTSKIENIVQLILNNMDDNTVLTSILPKLPDPILEILVKDYFDIFTAIFGAYDDAVSGPLPFEYCDVVADFYEKIFQWTDSYEIKSRILKRLPKLGYDHNRWRVGNVFAQIVSKLKDPTFIQVVREVLMHDNSICEWCEKYFKKYSLPKEITSVFEIPF